MADLVNQLILEEYDDVGELVWGDKERRPRWIRERSDYFEDYDDEDFKMRFRLSKQSALHILQLIEDKLEFPDDRNAAVSPVNQLLTTLRFYATGMGQLAAGDYGGFSKSTAHRIVHRVSAATAGLLPQYIHFPETEEDIKKTQLGFYNIASFPRVLGAVDCTHIKIKCPGGQFSELYRNRKLYFSLNIQAICNSNFEFTDIVARWPGSSHDSTIFNNSYRRAVFESGKYRNSLLLVDAGYPCRPYLMPPLDHPQTAAQHAYNESQIRTRNVVERLFGVWKRRFPVLALGLQVKVKNTLPIIVATAVLHNLLWQQGDSLPPDDPQVHLPAPWEVLLSEGEIRNRQSRDLCTTGRQFSVRDALITDYFSNLVEGRGKV